MGAKMLKEIKEYTEARIAAAGRDIASGPFHIEIEKLEG